MVIINDNDEQKWLQKQTSGKGYFWMGLTDREEENAWRWLDGTEPAFSQWKPGQPDNWSHGHERGEDCAGLIHEGLWNDFFCEDLISYICEKATEYPKNSRITSPSVEEEEKEEAWLSQRRYDEHH